VPCASVVDDVIAATRFSLDEKRAEVRVEPDLPTIVCDAVRIRQVFENLIANAVKYNDKPRPLVEIGYREAPGEHVLFVRDNGPGIEARYQEKVFRIFQRLVPREEHDGTGVGLTICKKIVEGHGGRIWVESDGLGQGSTFLLGLPMSLRASRTAKE
jgi:light-regulated signal transduction histidine kinase (bacteriophytochrome)